MTYFRCKHEIGSVSETGLIQDCYSLRNVGWHVASTRQWPVKRPLTQVSITR